MSEKIPPVEGSAGYDPNDFNKGYKLTDEEIKIITTGLIYEPYHPEVMLPNYQIIAQAQEAKIKQEQMKRLEGLREDFKEILMDYKDSEIFNLEAVNKILSKITEALWGEE